MSNYALVNKQTNICDNVVSWDGDTNKWQPPETHMAMLVDTTPSLRWRANYELNEWESVECMGYGSPGDIWDGTRLCDPQPTGPLPPYDPPVEEETIDPTTTE
jgi:hypothetical protein